jgi:hypothetical protein
MRRPALDHDDFGLNQSKIMNVIDSKSLERDAGGKPVSTFPHPALERVPINWNHLIDKDAGQNLGAGACHHETSDISDV